MDLWVSGCNGFIGQRLWQLATAAGHSCQGIDIADGPYGLRAALDSNAYAIPDGATVIHLAAVSTDKACKADPVAAMDVNIGGTLAVLKRAKNCRRFLFASSEWVYPNVESRNCKTDENYLMTCDRMGLYAFTKYVGEELLRRCDVLSTHSLRFGIVYGPNRPREQWSAVESIFDKVSRGETVRLGSPHTARRFVHIDDLCRGIISAAMCSNPMPFVLNLTGNELVSLDTVFADAVDVCDGETHYTNGYEKPSIRNPDNALAKKVLGWNPSITIRDYFQSLHAASLADK